MKLKKYYVECTEKFMQIRSEGRFGLPRGTPSLSPRTSIRGSSGPRR